mmetsp:Transcript_10836/g.24820  ORF Transcript_10836/g.24820 Transcript_10836/m.24820 type:complete len:698 (-) Transcript_10836:98-2191(-)
MAPPPKRSSTKGRLANNNVDTLLRFDATRVPYPQVDEDSGVRLDGPWPVPMDGIEAWEAGGRVVLAWDLGPSPALTAQLENSVRFRPPGRGSQVLQPAIRIPNGPWTIGLWVKWTEGDIVPYGHAPLLRFSGGLTLGLDAHGLGFAGPEVEAARRGNGLRPGRLQVPRNVWTAVFLAFTDEGEEVCNVYGAWDSRGLTHVGTLGPAPCRKELIGLGGDHHAGYLAQFCVWPRLLDNQEQGRWFGTSAGRFGIAVQSEGDESPGSHDLTGILQKIAAGANRLRRDSIASIGSISPRDDVPAGRRRKRIGAGRQGQRRSSLESMVSLLSPRSPGLSVSPPLSPIAVNNVNKIRRISRLLNAQVQSGAGGPTKPSNTQKASQANRKKNGPAGQGANPKNIAKGNANDTAAAEEESPFGGAAVVLTHDEHAALIQHAARLLVEADENDPGDVGQQQPPPQAWNEDGKESSPSSSSLAARRAVQPPKMRLPGFGQGLSNGNLTPKLGGSAREGKPSPFDSGSPMKRLNSKAAGPLNRAALLSSLAHCYAAAAYEWFEDENEDEMQPVESMAEGIGFATLPALANSIRAWPFNKTTVELSTPKRVADRWSARVAAEDELLDFVEPTPPKAERPPMVARSLTLGARKSISRRVKDAEQQVTRNHKEMKRLRTYLDDLTPTPKNGSLARPFASPRRHQLLPCKTA